MSATKNKRAKNTCKRKVAHLTEVAAVESAAKFAWRGVEAYKCSVCPGWHTGRRPDGTTQPTAAVTATAAAEGTTDE